MAYCTKCKKSNPDTAKFCTICGEVLRTNMPAPTSIKSSSNPWKLISILAIVALVVAGYFLLFNKGRTGKEISGHESETPIKTLDKSDKEQDETSKDKGSFKPGVQVNDPNSSAIAGRFPLASERLLTNNDLIGLSLSDLKIMRNEIYARHGYIFKKDDMRQYFNSQSWYQPLYNNVDNLLSLIEKSNIYLIKDFEK